MLFVNAEFVICLGCGHAVLLGEGICILCGTALLDAHAPLDEDFSREKELVDLAAKECSTSPCIVLVR